MFIYILFLVMKAALYSRVSTEDQNPLLQKNALIKTAELEGWDYTYFEEVESTRKTRPIKNKLYHRLLKKEFGAVIVWKLDRWGRSVRELVTEIETLYTRGVKFISMMDPVDLSTDTGWLQFQIISAFAEFERDMISERTKQAFYVDDEGVTRSVKSGKAVGKRGKEKKDKPRRKSGYHQRWANQNKKRGSVIEQ